MSPEREWSMVDILLIAIRCASRYDPIDSVLHHYHVTFQTDARASHE